MPKIVKEKLDVEIGRLKANTGKTVQELIEPIGSLKHYYNQRREGEMSVDFLTKLEMLGVNAKRIVVDEEKHLFE